jgi:hypothetical protein
MKLFRAGIYALASLAVTFAFSTPSRAEIRWIDPVQTLSQPAGFTFLGERVAIDGGYIIALGGYEGGQQALLYRRNSNGVWIFRRSLVTWNGPYTRSSVAMRNGLAAVQFGDQITLFELGGGDYVRQTSTAPIRHHGGVAISGKRVLIGGNNCDYDAVIYEKNSGGSWAITGRLDDNQGECLDPYYNYSVELNYDYALIRPPYGRDGIAWRRNGTTGDWVRAGTLPVPTDEGVTTDGAHALQKATAVAPNGVIWRRSGTSTWIRQAEVLKSVDYENGFRNSYGPVYRDGVLLATHSSRYGGIPAVHVETSPGRFEHVGALQVYRAIAAYDVSKRTVVAGNRGIWGGMDYEVQVFNLPTQLAVPPQLVNDFEDRNASDFMFSGGQFALAMRGSDDVLAQSAGTGLAVAVMSDSDWTDTQHVAADITPAFGAGSWVGLVARYVDADNYYSMRIRDNQMLEIYKRVNGVDTLLSEFVLYNQLAPTFRATLDVSGNRISASVQSMGVGAVDNSLTHGRGGVATFMARADFDDVHLTGTDIYSLFERQWGFGGSDYEIGMDVLSGDWAVLDDNDPENSSQTGLWQRDSSGNAVAVIGEPVPNQDITARMNLTSYAASSQGAWFGLLARYVDARNHYYVTVRSTGQIQIRKMVNGVITVLATSNFTAVPGRYYNVRFVVINDQLHLYVDNLRVASAHDHDLTLGRYGIATYRAAANWDTFSVLQP